MLYTSDHLFSITFQIVKLFMRTEILARAQIFYRHFRHLKNIELPKHEGISMMGIKELNFINYIAHFDRCDFTNEIPCD